MSAAKPGHEDEQITRDVFTVIYARFPMGEMPSKAWEPSLKHLLERIRLLPQTFRDAAAAWVAHRKDESKPLRLLKEDEQEYQEAFKVNARVNALQYSSLIFEFDDEATNALIQSALGRD